MRAEMNALSWFTLSSPVAWWWTFLLAVSALNIALWVKTRNMSGLWRPMVRLSGAFVLGCAFRSVFPRADVQRIVLFDTCLSSVAVGRTVATIAELSFVAQWALALNTIARSRKARFAVAVSLVMVPLIVSAECFSWYAVISTNYLGNAIEESHWTLTFALFGLAVASLIPGAKGASKTALIATVIGSALYVAFMANVDVPMYVARWRADVAAGRAFFGFADGLRDVSINWRVTHSIDEWREEIPWMSLYFSVAVWGSLALARLTPERLKKF